MQDRTGHHKWFCLIDNKSVIQKLEKYSNDKITSKRHLQPDADILELTAKQLTRIPLNFIHVKVHQDRKSGKMFFDAQLNCTMADELAKCQNASMATSYTQNYPNYCYLSINNMIVTRDSQKWLREAAGRIPIQQYYKDKNKWSKATFDSIHWSAQQTVLSRYDINDRRRILLKFVHGWLPTYD
jgi:hypothetical protein